MLDQTQGLRHLIDRMEMGPRLKQLVKSMEAEVGSLDKIPDNGGREVRQLLHLVDGPTLCAAIVAHLIDRIPVEDVIAAPPPSDTRYDRWLRTQQESEAIVLLLDDDAYFAYDNYAERIADTLQTHLVEEGQHKIIALSLDQQADWIERLVEANLDVSLVELDPDGFTETRILEGGPPVTEEAEGEQDPLDHDGNGEKGGSLPGEQSTARRGWLRRNKDKTPA